MNIDFGGEGLEFGTHPEFGNADSDMVFGAFSDEEDDNDFGIVFDDEVMDDPMMFESPSEESQFMTLTITTKDCDITLIHADGTKEVMDTTKENDSGLDVENLKSDQIQITESFDLDFAYITSLPLVLQTNSNASRKQYVDVPALDIETEERNIIKCLNDAGWRIRFKHEIATQATINSTFEAGAKVIHYSGHGQVDALVLEKETEPGAGAAFSPKDLYKLLTARKDKNKRVRIPVKLVFVSACHSRLAGEAFMKAGVEHVVAVRTENELSDQAAKNFTKHFYYALFKGRTVQEAFNIGKAIIQTGDFYVRTQAEKFLLLPEDGDHFVNIFGNIDLPEGKVDNRTLPPVKNLLPRKWQPFEGRNQMMHKLMQYVVSDDKQMTWLYGKKGIGKTTLLSMLAHYLRDRHQFPAGLYYLDLKEAFEDEYPGLPQQPNKPPALRKFLAQLFEDADVFSMKPGSFRDDSTFLKELTNAFKDAAESKQQEMKTLQATIDELSRAPSESRDESRLATLRRDMENLAKHQEQGRFGEEPKFLLILDSVLDFCDQMNEIQWIPQWKKDLKSFFDKFVDKCTGAKILAASRDRWTAKQKFTYIAEEVGGLDKKAAEKIFLNRAPEEFWKETIKRDGDLQDHEIMEIFEIFENDRDNYCPGFIVDCCFEMHINHEFQNKSIDDFSEYDFDHCKQEYLERAPIVATPVNNRMNSNMSENRIHSMPHSQSNIGDRMPSQQAMTRQWSHNDNLPQQNPNMGGGASYQNQSQQGIIDIKQQPIDIGEAEEEENRWEQVQELKKILRKKKSQHWDRVMRIIRDPARENHEMDIDNFLRAFVETIPALLEDTQLSKDVYKMRPISDVDIKLILEYFEKKAKIFDVDKTEFENDFWNYFKSLFETLVLLRRYYFTPRVPRLIEGYISKQDAESMLNTAYKTFKKKSVGAFVVRFSESKPGWIALAANMENYSDKRRRIKHYRIEVCITDSYTDTPFRVNVGDNAKHKHFKTLNTVLRRMQLKFLCVHGGTKLIRREYVFRKPEFPA